jgi:hypothetical protein
VATTIAAFEALTFKTSFVEGLQCNGIPKNLDPDPRDVALLEDHRPERRRHDD